MKIINQFISPMSIQPSSRTDPHGNILTMERIKVLIGTVLLFQMQIGNQAQVLWDMYNTPHFRDQKVRELS